MAGALTDQAAQGSFTANSSMFDVWLPVVSSSSVAGEMDAVLSNSDTNSNYYEDYENGFDISLFLQKQHHRLGLISLEMSCLLI